MVCHRTAVSSLIAYLNLHYKWDGKRKIPEVSIGTWKIEISVMLFRICFKFTKSPCVTDWPEKNKTFRKKCREQTSGANLDLTKVANFPLTEYIAINQRCSLLRCEMGLLSPFLLPWVQIWILLLQSAACRPAYKVWWFPSPDILHLISPFVKNNCFTELWLQWKEYKIQFLFFSSWSVTQHSH